MTIGTIFGYSLIYFTVKKNKASPVIQNDNNIVAH